jgi:hypothetical protein
MVATVVARDDTGGTDNSPGATATQTNLRYKEADNNTQDLVNPVTIPAAGTKYSFWKHTFLEVTAAGGFTQIDNVNLWVDTFNWTGTTLWIDDASQTALTHNLTSPSTVGYDVADGLDILSTHTHITTPVNHGTTHTSSGTAKVINISEAGGIINIVNETSDYWVTNVELTTSAVAGLQTARTENIEYDEI